MTPTRPNLFGYGRRELIGLMRDLGQPVYRAGLLFRWLYGRRVRSLAEMTDLSRPLRERLQEGHDLRWPEVAERNLSSDGTVKLLFRLDSATVEKSPVGLSLTRFYQELIFLVRQAAAGD